MDDKVLIAIIGAGVTLLAVGLKFGYDYWREKVKKSDDEVKVWNDLIFRLIQLHTETVKMKNSLNSHKDIEKFQSEELVGELDKLGDHFEESLDAVAKIDPVLAVEFKVSSIIKLLHSLAKGFREEQKTVDEKKLIRKKSGERLSPIELKKRILGLENKLKKTRRELNTILNKIIKYGLPGAELMINYMLKSASKNLHKSVQKKITKNYPYSLDDAQELIKLYESLEKKSSENSVT